MLDFDTLEVISLYTPEQENMHFTIFIGVLFILIFLAWVFDRTDNVELLTGMVVFIFFYIIIVPSLSLKMPDRRYRVEVKNLTEDEENLLMEENIGTFLETLQSGEEYPYSIENGKLYFNFDVGYECREELGYKGVENLMDDVFKEHLLRNFGKIKIKQENDLPDKN